MHADDLNFTFGIRKLGVLAGFCSAITLEMPQFKTDANRSAALVAVAIHLAEYFAQKCV
jgi:hypothetical protein